MRDTAHLDSDGKTITVTIPFTFKRRSGQRIIVIPDGPISPAPQSTSDVTLVKALARARRWQQMLESGEYASSAELARAERVAKSYLCRILRLTLLAPSIVEAMLDGQHIKYKPLIALLKGFPSKWNQQEAAVRVR